MTQFTRFNADVLVSHSSDLGTGGTRQRRNAGGALDDDYFEGRGAQLELAGCLDAPDVMPAGSTLVRWAMDAPRDPVRICATTMPSVFTR